MMDHDGRPPTASIVVSTDPSGKFRAPSDSGHRAVHKISLSALSHNYAVVESAAHRQRCDVICVTKADSYGHGAIPTAKFLADSVGASAFAVATLEEAIALRKAFQSSNSNGQATVQTKLKTNNMAALFQSPSDDATLSTDPTSVTSKFIEGRPSHQRNFRPSNIRILVLGPPVGFPRCFDDYYHYNIEVMISGPEVASALFEWVQNTEERKRIQVEHAATEAKELALKAQPPPAPRNVANKLLEHRDSTNSDASTSEHSQASDSLPRYRSSAVTLGNMTGTGLAKEVREILRNQKLVEDSQQAQDPQPIMVSPHSKHSSGVATPQTLSSTRVTPVSSEADLTSVIGASKPNAPVRHAFAGIEEAARISRNFHKAVASEVFQDKGEDDDAGAGVSTVETRVWPISNQSKKTVVTSGVPRKRLRWHGLVDSGMGRLGFRTDPVSKEEQGKRRDSVEILKELVDLEVKIDCPIEFFGMVTHMADANSTSTYTDSQIRKFKALLKRVRSAGISIPTMSTDNSSALLTTNLTHFDPKELLTQDFAETRGFVRVGGAIYGQRPAFPQLRAVSTLMAYVRHVATLKCGESVGYDRAYVAKKNVRIATLTIGFADGYPRELGNKNAQVAIRGGLFWVVGNVCMDMMMVELGAAEEKDSIGAQVVVGDTAILWGPAEGEEGDGQIQLKDLATKLKTTQSALTCGLDKERVLRQYE